MWRGSSRAAEISVSVLLHVSVLSRSPLATPLALTLDRRVLSVMWYVLTVSQVGATWLDLSEKSLFIRQYISTHTQQNRCR